MGVWINQQYKVIISPNGKAHSYLKGTEISDCITVTFLQTRGDMLVLELVDTKALVIISVEDILFMAPIKK